MRVLLLGAPGSGKRTQAKLLMEKHNVPHIATGDLLREAIRNKTPLGSKARTAMEAGQLVPNEVVLGIIAGRLADADTEKGYILDGFPRNIDQARELDNMLRDLGQSLQLAVMLEVDADILLQRLTGRRTCIHCSAVYNVYTSPPKIEDRCDDCGDVLKHRPDDHETTIEQRLRIFQMQTRPLVSYYRNQKKLRTIQAIGDINDISTGINKIVSQIGQMSIVDNEPDAPVDEIVNAPSVVVIEPLPPVVLPEIVKRQTKLNIKKAAANDESIGKPRKVTPKKKTVKKQAAKKKATIKKTVKKKVVQPKGTLKKTATKKVVAKKKVAKKKIVKKAVLKKKTTVKKTTKKKSAAKKKAVIKKTAKKKVVHPKGTLKKKADKKSALMKKAVAKKTAKKKSVKKKVAKIKKRAKR